MTSRILNNHNEWFTKLGSILESQDTPTKTIGLKRLVRSVDKYVSINGSELEAKSRARKLILEASKRIIERRLAGREGALHVREGSRRKLRIITTTANQISDVLERVLIPINETDYARKIVTDFLPNIEEAARYATELDPETAAQMLRIFNSADAIGFCYKRGLREVFEEIIQQQIVPNRLSKSRVLFEQAETRFNEGEYLTSYILSREAVRSMLEEIAGAYPEDLSLENKPGPEWRMEDYIGYLTECGLLSETQAKEFVDLFVGEPEHLNSRWRKKKDAERALLGVEATLDQLNGDDFDSDEWL